MTLASALPLLVVVACLGVLGPSVSFAATLAALVLLPHVFRGRIELGKLAQLLAGFVVFALALALGGTLLPRPAATAEALPLPWATLAGAVLVVAAARRFVALPAGGEPAGLGLGLIALMACGGSQSDRLYLATCVAYLAAAVVARRSSSTTRAPLGVLVRRHAPALAAMLVVGGGVAFALASSLPDAHGWAMQRLLAGRTPIAGVGARLWLGSMRGLLDSPQPVLRVAGDVELLRGITYDRYDVGRWSRDESAATTLTTPTSLTGDGVVELEWLDGEPRRYFTPPDAAEVAFSSGLASVDPLGNLEPIEAHPALRTFARRATRREAEAPPTPQDLRVPASSARTLERMARAFTAGLATDGDRLAAIERELRANYRYSLEFDRSPFGDPVLEFLGSSREGHCEYFASALALLARSVGIPARVVVGYRVVERNPLTGRAIVRERDAHAWVEAWDGGWRTYDPTPTGEGALASGRVTPLPLALADALGAEGARFLEWLDRRTLGEALGAPALALGLALVLHRLRSRRLRGVDPALGELEPLECFTGLAAALARHGLEVRAGETVEGYAARVGRSALPEDLAAGCERALLGYAALRFGDLGEPTRVAAGMDALARRLRS